jgi:hypothetical protein
MAMASTQVTARVLTDNGGATTNITFLSLPTATHGVTVRYTDAVAANPIANPTMADNQGVGNSYVKAISATEANSGQMAGIWRCDSIGATSGTFTLTITHAAATSNYSLVSMQEVNQAIQIDKTASSTTTVSGVTTVTTAALSSADELVVAAYTEDSSRSNSGLTCTVGYSSDMLEVDSTAHISASGNHKIVSSSSAVSAIYTVSTSGFVDASRCRGDLHAGRWRWWWHHGGSIARISARHTTRIRKRSEISGLPKQIWRCTENSHSAAKSRHHESRGER